MILPLRDYLPRFRTPAVTMALIALNVLVFLFGFGRAQYFVDNTPVNVSKHDVWVYEWGTIPCELLQRCDNQLGRAFAEHNDLGQLMGGGRTISIEVREHSPWLTVLASAFIHGSFLHLIFNMLFLWVFGGGVEDAMGRSTFLGFYLGGGIVAALAQAFITPNSAIPQIGASGAIAAVMGGYLLLYPRAKVLTIVILPIFLRVPAWAVVGGWGLMQFIATWRSLYVPGAGANGIAYMAHLAGFAYGMAVVHLFATPNPIYDQLYRPEVLDVGD